MLPTYTPPEHLPPPVDLLPTLRVSIRTRRVYLSQALVTQLSLRAGQPIDLRPPTSGSPYWYLDLRPKAKRRVDWYQDTRPRIQCVSLPAGLLAPGQSVTLQLLPGEPEYPNYYPLLPRAQAA